MERAETDEVGNRYPRQLHAEHAGKVSRGHTVKCPSQENQRRLGRQEPKKWVRDAEEGQTGDFHNAEEQSKAQDEVREPLVGSSQDEAEQDEKDVDAEDGDQYVAPRGVDPLLDHHQHDAHHRSHDGERYELGRQPLPGPDRRDHQRIKRTLPFLEEVNPGHEQSAGDRDIEEDKGGQEEARLLLRDRQEHRDPGQ